MLPILSKNSHGLFEVANSILFPDLQSTLHKDIVAKLCSFTDPGSKGSYTTNPKGIDIWEIPKYVNGNANVTAMVSSNISQNLAVRASKAEHSGVFRRTFKFSFNYEVKPANDKAKDSWLKLI